MSLLDQLVENSDLDDFDIRLEQRRMALIQQINESLERKGWSQSDLAEKMGKQNSQVTRLLSPTSNPTLKTIVEIEAALDEELLTVNRNIKFKIKDRHLGKNQYLSQRSGTITSPSGEDGPRPGSYEDVKMRVHTQKHSTHQQNK